MKKTLLTILVLFLLSFSLPVTAEEGPTPAKEQIEEKAQEVKPSKFWKTRNQVFHNKHVFTARLGSFFNRIDGDQASTQSEGYFLSSFSYILGFDWEYQQVTGWSTLMSAGFKIYRYKRDIDPTLFAKDKTFYHPELWMGMGKRFKLTKPMMLKIYVGSYNDHYYYAPTFFSLEFESDRLFAFKTQLDWTAYQWKRKEIGVEVFSQLMRRGNFLRGGSEHGLRVLFSAYPLRFKYEFSASWMKTSSLKYRMLEGAVLIEYLFGR